MKLFLFLCILGLFKIKGGSSSWVSDESLHWPIDEPIYYYIDPQFSVIEQRQIKDAFEELSGSLYPDCLSFQELRGDGHGSKECMHFIRMHSNTCQSDLGMQRAKPTEIKLGPACFTRGIILHQIVHALGSAHEQSRPDRDFYISINWENIEDGKQHNFRIDENFTRTSETPYDFFSIVHYPRYAHAKNASMDTITSRFDLGKDALGYEMMVLSVTDKIELSKIFECPVDKSLEEDYLIYIDELFTEVMEKFRICIESSTRPDKECKSFGQVPEVLLKETRRVSPRNLFHHHNTVYQVALNRLNQRRLEWNMGIEVQGIKSKSIVSATKFHKELTQTREKIKELEEGLNTQAVRIQQLSEQLEQALGKITEW